jgi:chemotaxis protein MotB
MSTVRGVREAVCVAAGLAMLVGCADNEHRLQVNYLQDQVNQLETENGDLQSQLRLARGETGGARTRALELQTLLNEARRELAQRTVSTDLPEGWNGTADIAWKEIAGGILFDSGKDKLKKTAGATLATVVADIEDSFPDYDIWVVGHTDNDPIKKSSWADNLALSLARAANVARELEKQGIDPRRVTAGGQGEHRPKVENKSRDGKKQNRRVEIIAVRRPEMNDASNLGVGDIGS